MLHDHVWELFGVIYAEFRGNVHLVSIPMTGTNKTLGGSSQVTILTDTIN